MHKIQPLQIAIEHLVCFLYLMHKRYDTFLRPSQCFLINYDRCNTFFKKAL